MTSGMTDVSFDGLRAVAGRVAPAPASMEPYLDKVRRHAFKVTDADVEALKAAGASEDEIFEQTVVVAVAQGLARLDAAERVIR